jgi:hypothetical protein
MFRKKNLVTFFLIFYKLFFTQNVSAQVTWSTYFGGESFDGAYSIVTDASGNVYITGHTSSINKISTSGAFQTSYGGSSDAFIAKFNTNGNLQWATYFGGPGYEMGKAIVLDANNNIYIAGEASGVSHLATQGAHQEQIAGAQDAFLAKFNSSGNLLWCTYFGGSLDESVTALKTSPQNEVYLVGYTKSNVGIATGGSHQSNYGGGDSDGFIIKFNESGARQWATYVGGNKEEYLYSLAISTGNHIYVGGYTGSTNGLSTQGVHQATYGGGDFDGFLLKFDSNGQRLWGTYNGGPAIDGIMGITFDKSENVLVLGSTSSTSNIATTGTYQATFKGGNDGFVTKFSPSGQRIWATYYGGEKDDYPNSIATDQKGNILITGSTNSLTGLASTNSWQTNFGGGFLDAFVAVIDSSGKNRLMGTYLGGSGSDEALKITIDKQGDFYIAGSSSSTASIATANAHQTTFGGMGDGFLTKVSGFTTGINEFNDNSKFNFFPNPVSNVTTIVLPDFTTTQTFEIINMAGTSIFKKEIESSNQQIDLSHLRSGLYFIRIGDSTHKLIKL